MTEKDRANIIKMMMGADTNKPHNTDQTMINYTKDVAKLTKYFYESYIEQGFSKEDSFELALTMTQTVMMGGFKNA